LDEIETVTQVSGQYRHLTNRLPYVDGGPTDEHGNGLQALADARLIAAAPELLEALRILTEHAQERYPHFESDRGFADIERAQAAIAKAEGK
jgi:hypothetical protein